MGSTDKKKRKHKTLSPSREIHNKRQRYRSRSKERVRREDVSKLKSKDRGRRSSSPTPHKTVKQKRYSISNSSGEYSTDSSGFSRSRSRSKSNEKKHSRHGSPKRRNPRRSQSPRRRSLSPRRRSLSPWRSQSPRRRSRSPKRRSRSPRRRSRSPRRSCRSPRKRSRSPRDQSVSASSDSSKDSSSSNSSSESEDELSEKEKKRQMKKRKQERRKLREERMRLKREKKRNKEMIKITETAEEKRARRLAKKAEKERKRKERMGWDKEMMEYTNADNPFGDPNLLETFVWDKKNKKMGIKDNDKEDLKKKSRQKQIENRLELQKVKQRRQEREREKEERDRELEVMQRLKENEQYKEWEQQEDSFHLQQAKMRSKIRIQDGRAKSIDLLAQYISAEDEDDLAVEMHEPYKVLHGLSIVDLEDLLEDIKVYIELEQGKNVDFWKDMTIITEDELVKLRKIDPKVADEVERREGINASVSSEVADVFKGKTSNQLLAMKDQILKRIKSGSAVDIGYWESLLQQLKAHMAKARLRERHQERLRNKLYRLQQEQRVAPKPLFPSGMTEDESNETEKDEVKDSDEIVLPPDGEEEEEGEEGASKPSTSTAEEQAEGESILTEEDLIRVSQDEYTNGRYSPVLLTNKDLAADTLIFDAEEDDIRLQHARNQVLGTGSAKDTAEAEFEKKAREGMGRDEATFAVEVPSDKLYLWSDKYRPRKPRYFNRVHTGFEWNKYNQTHYDMDNPPPKIVQGYKFNIFYPDLIDKRNTPEYTLTSCEDNRDFSILKFHAGPPYEDIAFKIVNREWEYSHRHGFRCQYSNGIFQLWFHFKRYRYRR
uniref:Splicing factor Cactin n=1 Tax=Saccoglossus kowalevskii TaxID=10224 RepID=A0ABM0N179_SACKO|nr:PREDICTED: cactin-like isoform X2 [Saccoglossus kowalevskii]